MTLVPHQSSQLAPADLLAQLIPDKVIDDDMSHSRIYWFKKGPKKGTDFAMLIIKRGSSTFRVQFYPKADTPQFAANLGMDQLPVIVADLVQAGFPIRAAPLPPRDRNQPTAGTPKPVLPQGGVVSASLTEGTIL